MIRIHWITPCARDDIAALRRFGLLAAAFICVVFGLVLPFIFTTASAFPNFIALGIAAVIGLVAMLATRSIYFIYRPWLFIASVMNTFNTVVLMAIVYYLLITPVALIMRLLGKLQYSFTGRWHNVEHSPTKDNLKDVF